MRRALIAGNWKMNLDRAGAISLAKGVAEQAREVDHADLAVIPPSVYVDAVASVLQGSNVAWGVQNVYWKPNGAFTGEISVAMAKDLGCRYVVIGHSERRHILGESDEDVNNKVHAVIDGGLVPIICVGETLEEREKERTLVVVERQTLAALAGVSADKARGVVLAYEPVWAIGTGKNATPAQAEEVHVALRKVLAGRYNREIAEAIRIQYGGSVKPDNARELLSQPNIDGALVGGASLKVDQFLGIVAGLSR
ncbi:MAG: triose-phosphate isomerase [Thermoguttaceae bacterium]|jgi:triosephosphate isomerase|nr:triose-phosphate isomerase [Thermoguttaceae bacterium]